MSRKAILVEAPVREHRTHTVGLPPERPEWWALYDAAPQEHRRVLTSAPAPVAGRIWIVTWRLPFGVRGVDVRYFRDWRREVAPRAGRVLLAVELEGPPGDAPRERDAAVQAQLDELSWVIERLWLASAEAPFERPMRDRRPTRRDGAADVGSAPSGANDQAASPPSASNGTTGLILLRPDGATMLGTPLAPQERHALDIAVGSQWVTAADVRSTVAPRSGLRAAEATSRLLGHLRSVGAIHPAERRDDGDGHPKLDSSRGGQRRLHRSALHAATRAMLDSLDLREVPSRFSRRQALLTMRGEALWASQLRARLREAGLLTV